VDDRKDQLDSRIRVVTPENIAFEYRLAGPFWRLPAYLIDLAVRVALYVLIAFTSMLVFGLAGVFSAGILIIMVSWLVLSWFYGGLFETFWNGQTPGKRMMHLRVISTDGRPINALQAILRNILRAVDALPTYTLSPEMVYPTYLLGLVVAASSNRYQRLGDIVCGTMVVVEERSGLHGVERVESEAIDQLAVLLPANWRASRTLSAALASYVERRRYFGPARRAEIARHVGGPLVERLGLPPDTDHDTLLGALYRQTFLSQPADELRPEPPAPVDAIDAKEQIPTSVG
jgi:uncharacterized RDD family membrane protein YckC